MTNQTRCLENASETKSAESVNRMLYQISRTVQLVNEKWAFAGIIILTYIISGLLLKVAYNVLPRDGGRDFAFNGKLSAGKPRGAGIILISVFIVISFLFIPLTAEYIIYYLLIFSCMLSGFLDDRSLKPWGQYKKGLIDFIISVITAVSFVNFNGSQINVPFGSKAYLLSKPLFILLATIFIWISINVTNCSDGIDGFAGTLSIITMASIGIVLYREQQDSSVCKMIVILVMCILAYLWINAEPSKLIMGDAGSRAIGLFISICILETKNPFLYIPLAFILIVDRIAGLIKIFFLRFFNINFFKNIRTPIHDHVRKNMKWSNSQTIFRFSIIQLIISALTIIILK